MENDKIKREEIVRKWEESGLLDGLKGLYKPEISKLYECCSTAKLDEGILPVAVRLINELPPDQEIVTVIKKEENERKN